MAISVLFLDLNWHFKTDLGHDAVRSRFIEELIGRLNPDESEQAYCLREFMFFSLRLLNDSIHINEKNTCKLLLSLLNPLTEESYQTINAVFDLMSLNPDFFPSDLKFLRTGLSNAITALEKFSDLSDKRTLINRCKTCLQDKLIEITELDVNKFNRKEKLDYEFLLCPISKQMMKDPITVSSGQTYDRESLVTYFKTHNNIETLPCPLTRIPIQRNELMLQTDETIKNKIINFINQQKTKNKLSGHRSIHFREVSAAQQIESQHHTDKPNIVSFTPRAKRILTEEQAKAYVEKLFQQFNVTLSDSLLEDEHRYSPKNKPYLRTCRWLQALEQKHLLSQTILQVFASNLWHGDLIISTLNARNLLNQKNLTDFCKDHEEIKFVIGIIDSLDRSYPNLLTQRNLTAIIDSGITLETIASKIYDIVSPDGKRMDTTHFNQDELNKIITNQPKLGV